MIARDRRSFVRTLAGGAAMSVAGCLGSSSPEKEAADVIAGPDGRFVFDPEEVTIQRGDSITWYFDSRGHNVCADPSDSSIVRIPEEAEPFASYGPDESAGTLEPAGSTFEHDFSTAGTYEYVCIPHQSSDMTGRIIVEG